MLRCGAAAPVASEYNSAQPPRVLSALRQALPAHRSVSGGSCHRKAAAQPSSDGQTLHPDGAASRSDSPVPAGTAAGTSIGKAVKTVCFLKNMSDFAAFNGVYGEYFTSKPARSCVAAKELPKDVLVEVEVIAEV